MEFHAYNAEVDDIRPWRDMYRRAMGCQIIHDSIHERSGWSREYVLRTGSVDVGYGSLAIGGPWEEEPTLYEFHVAPPYRTDALDAFDVLLEASGAVHIEMQSNDALGSVLLHAVAHNVTSESILFEDRGASSSTTIHPTGTSSWR